MKGKIFLLLFVLLCHKASTAQDLSINLSLERDSILIGDQVDMTLNIAYSKSLAFVFPEIGDTLTPGIEVVKRSPLDTLRSKKGEDLITVERKFTLTSFDAGVIYTLPRFQFFLNNKEGGVDTIVSNQLTLKVAFPPMDSTWQPNDIKAPIEYPITFAEAAPYVGGGLLLVALLVFFIYYLNQRRNNQPVFFKPKPKEPAHIIALRDLQKLKEEQLWQQNRTKDFYTRISEIIRVYIEDRFAVSAMEQTSDEILAEFEAQKICTKKDLEVLREVFYTSDLVKFAKHTPAPDENETCFHCTQEFVEQTKITE
jgi:hypothetical protein